MATVRIENRSQLIYLLTEAAEIEHNVLCCYLFAQFTMKSDVSEGLTASQLQAADRWRDTLADIAIQEMLHLAAACNLLTAVGGAPQLRRPNLPASPRAYPSAFKLRLVPFSLEALDQFVFLERPEQLDEGAQSSPDYRGAALPEGSVSDAFSRERDYSTLGQLYRGIEDGLTYLSQKLGEARLFVGRPDAQTADTFFRLPGLRPVHDLASALQALKVIIEQGEGASPDSEDSHYRRFLAMRDECRRLTAEDPSFCPGRPVLTSPYAVEPTDLPPGTEFSRVGDPLSVDLCNLFDACYELMVQVLGRLFVHAEESEAELQTLASVGVGMMAQVLEKLGSALTLLPAGRSHPGLNAGPSFRLSRGASIPTDRLTARFIFQERLKELTAYCHVLRVSPACPAVLAEIGGALTGFATLLESQPD